MPILISIDATNNTAAGVSGAVNMLTTLSGALDKVTAAGTDAKAAMTGIGAEADRQAAGMGKMADATKLLNSGLRGTNTAVDAYIRAMEKLDAASVKGKLGFTAIKDGTIILNSSLTDSMAVIDAFIAKLGEMDAAAALSRGALASIGRLSMGTVGGGGGSGGGGFGTPGPGNFYGTSAAMMGPLGIYGNHAVSFGGNRIGSGVLGGIPMPALLAGVATIAAGVYATEQASKFWSAVAQTTAQSGGTVGPGSDALGHSILNYAASGKSPYRATVEAQGIEPLLAHGISAKAIQQALPSIAQLSAQNEAPDLTNAVKLINTLVAPYGSKATGAQLTHAADWSSKLESMTSILPGLVTTSIPTMLGKIAGTGVSDSEAAGMLVKVGMQNPSARLDATSISRMIQDIALKPTAGAQKTANALGVGIGPGAIQAYGGTYNYLGALQAALAADKNGAQDAAKIFTQTNALSAYKVLTMGGGLGQASGYTQQLGNVDGSANKAFDQYSQGTQQQGAQLMNRLNADFTSMGTVLNSTVVPQLINLGNAALFAAEKMGGVISSGIKDMGDLGNFLDKHLPGGVKTNELAMLGLPGGAIPAALSYLKQNVSLPGGGDKPNGGYTPIPKYMSRAGTAGGFLQTYDNTPLSSHLLFGGTIIPSMPGNAAMPGGYNAHADSTLVGSNFGGRVATYSGRQANIDAYLAKLNAPVPESVHKTIQDDRATINALIKLGASAGQVSQELAKLKHDLGRAGSGYSAQSTSNISGLESSKVNDYITAIKQNVLGGKVGADQDNLAVAQALGQTPQQLKSIFDQYITDQRSLIMLEKPGLARTLALNSLGKQEIIGNAGYDGQGRDRVIKDAQNQAAIDKLNGNMGAYSNDLRRVFALQSKQPGMDASDVALLKANMLNELGALNPKTNIHPFYQQNPGVGGLIAGINSTAVRVGGGKDPQSEAIHELQKMLDAANQRYENLLQQIANNTAGRRPTARTPGSITQGQRSANA